MQILRMPSKGDDGSNRIDLIDMTPPKQDLDIGFLGSIIGPVKFSIIRHNAGTSKMTADIVMQYHHRRFVGPDERIIIFSKTTKTADKRPGEAVSYDFYPSQHKRFVIVTRRIYHRMYAVYGYLAHHEKLIPIHFHGKRLDEHIVDCILRLMQKRDQFTDFDTRVFFFEKWIDENTVSIRCSLRHDEEEPIGIRVTVKINLLSGRVSLL